MKDFTASNGVKVTIDAAGVSVLSISKGGLKDEVAGAPRVEALREFFRAEEDERLGRWRWPADPRFVVYPPRDGFMPVGDELCDLLILNEEWGSALSYVRSESASYDGPEEPFASAADAYFDAHPEPKQIPNEPHTAWVDRYGTDTWVVGFNGVLRCVASPSSDPEKYAPFTRLVPEVKQ